MSSRLATRPWYPELLLLGASVCTLAVGNRRFLAAALGGRPVDEVATWSFGLALAVALTAINFLLLGLLAWGRLFRPAVVVTLVLTAGAAHFIDSFGTFIDAAMLRNALHTHWSEARELVGPRAALSLLMGAALPAWLLLRCPPAPRRWTQALAWRGGAIGLALLVLALAIWAMFQPLASLMRQQHGVRYLVTPGNVLWSSAALARRAQAATVAPLATVGGDAHAGPALAHSPRARVVVLVIGETARAANWQLAGHARPTTPRLAQTPGVLAAEALTCGTDTETSLPCMFAPVGRRAYDEATIRGSQSLLQVLARAGIGVTWRDNQSGCKGVCDGLPALTIDAGFAPNLCDGDRCLDEALSQDLAQRLKRAQGTQLWVLHMLGNHGPSYYRRYPRAFARFEPDCRDDDLRKCSEQQVVNAYDNALLYTDHVLASAIRTLKAAAADVDTALIYVSDHGESLGEHGLFLHGLPYALAPEVQKRVPMVWWNSDGFERASGLAAGCLMASMAAQARQPVAHDHLFHTLLGALDVTTALHEPALDLTQPCRTATGL